MSQVTNNLSILVADDQADILRSAEQKAMIPCVSTSGTAERKIEVSLNDAILMTLASSYQIRLSELSPEISRKNVSIAKGVFEPSWFAECSENDVDTETADPVLLSSSDEFHASATGVQGLLP